jgi:hypothetical protein
MAVIAPSPWLIDKTRVITDEALEELDRELVGFAPGTRSAHEVPTLATIHDNKKWFGEADIRLDALVVTGYGQNEDPQSFYMPKTSSFGRVADGDRLPLGEGGLLIFHGAVLHFIDLFLLVSRDRKDTADLATLLAGGLRSDEIKGATGALLGMAVAAPQVATVTAAMGAATVLGEFAYRLLRAATGSTIGLYRNSHLQFRDGFGVGPHPSPPQRIYRVKDLSFRYEITLEEG